MKAYTGKVVQFDGIFQKAFVFRIPGNQLYNLLRVIMEFIYRARLEKEFGKSINWHAHTFLPVSLVLCPTWLSDTITI